MASGKMLFVQLFIVLILPFLVISGKSRRSNEKSEAPELSAFDSDAPSLDDLLDDLSAENDLDLASQPDVQEKIERLEREAFSSNPANPRVREIWLEVLQLDPRSGNAHVQLGIAGMFATDKEEHERGMIFLEKAFDPNAVDATIPMPTPQGLRLAAVVGRWRWERKEYDLARKSLLLASKHAHGMDVCIATQLATMLDPFPNSTGRADEMMDLYLSSSENFFSELNTKKWILNEQLLCQSVPGAMNDPYVHCVLTIFHLSFYHRADISRAANAQFNIASKLCPKLTYVPEKYRKYVKPKKNKKPCKDGRIRLGIVSGCLSIHHSVVNDFSGVLKRLDRNKFHISYIYLKERNIPIDNFVHHHEQDTIAILTKNDNDVCDGAWVTRYHPILEGEDFDILFYPDLTMSTQAQRLAMAKLAKVQATSHGHPVTSGIPKEIMNYYISWEAAELDYETSKDHYTEELVLLPKETMHQYYTPRSDGIRSLMDGGTYTHIKRTDNPFSDSNIPEDGNWYTCMQKPFKFQPEVDKLFCGILNHDPLGQLILHREVSSINQESFVRRLTNEGCDMSRVHFLDEQPHHLLLAMYSLSDVVLDSYSAGGCTTTREVLELGKAVVTLPSRLLGGRWSYAYYQIMGDEVLNDMVIAKSEVEYVDLAVQLGSNNDRRDHAEARIKASIHKLYGKEEAVRAWEKIFLDIAPVKLPEEGSRCKNEGWSWPSFEL